MEDTINPIGVFENWKSFPGLQDISDYLKNRVDTKQSVRLPLSFTTDVFENTVITSKITTEPSLYENENSIIVISKEGRKLLRENNKVLSNISDGNIEQYQPEYIGGCEEGRVYKIILSDNKPYALKFYFPINRQEENAILFTAGVDQMHWLQLAQRDKPLDGLEYTVPLIATIDMTIAPYVENAVDFYFAYQDIRIF